MLAGTRREGSALDGCSLTLSGRLLATRIDDVNALDRLRARHRDRTILPHEIRRLELAGACFVGEYGSEASVAPAELLGNAATAAGIAAVELHVSSRLNRDFADLISLLAMRICGAGAGAWSVTGADAWGLDLVRSDGAQVRRLSFPDVVGDGPPSRRCWCASPARPAPCRHRPGCLCSDPGKPASSEGHGAASGSA